VFGDFVIVRPDGVPVYNYAVVVDDALMKITHVIRGDDHLSNTPKQILIYNALGFDIPYFVHIPMILGQDHAKLSKRHGDTSLNLFKEKGYLPEAMFNFWHCLAGQLLMAERYWTRRRSYPFFLWIKCQKVLLYSILISLNG